MHSTLLLGEAFGEGVKEACLGAAHVYETLLA